MQVAQRQPSTVLFVCTANEGRSAIAEGLLKARLGRRAPTHAVTVGSAGTRAMGVPASAVVAAALVPYHIDISAHCSRQLTSGLIEEADLVLAMAGHHARAAVELSGAASLVKTFLLAELVGESQRHKPRSCDEPLAQYLRRMRSDSNRPRWWEGDGDPSADIEDPYGHPLWFLIHTAAKIDRLLAELVDNVFPDRFVSVDSSRPMVTSDDGQR